jgi:arylsulfatase
MRSLYLDRLRPMSDFSDYPDSTGGWVPNDRIVDSIDQSAFLLGQKKKSDRDGIVVYVGKDIYGVKWQNWKMMFKELNRGTNAVVEYPLPRFYNLFTDPKEEYPLLPDTLGNLWVRWPAGKILTDHLVSLKKEPPVPAGIPDPYVPSKN